MESIKMTQMRTFSNRRLGVSTGHLLLPRKANTGRTDLHSAESLAKGVP